MPTYVYKFTDTGETIEVHQAFTDDALTEYPHPSDGTMRPVKKVFQPVGVTFKGGGFYKTDSRGGSSSTSSASTAGSSSSSDSSSTSSSDSSGSSSTTTASPAAPSTPA
ncbi:MAG: FmdB family transcriptional regulator [Acidimicrobiia bacterium]|nr:FmdB family transcriptional regulator [Actinomycetota bacterium]NDB05095.1 FmdB family transcriptional regulator [Acidimicrobiia bacterium]NDH48918.1 FmdB family transcriptional regulator [Acidimicrobiia bacterium]